MLTSTGVVGPVRWAVANRALDGEMVSGDLHVVLPTDDGVLLAVIDGLGHGKDAAVAASEAALVLESEPSRSVVDALEACHRALGRTRGVVMSIVRVGTKELSWVGVGNVEAILIRGFQKSGARARLMLLGGVVGHNLPPARPGTSPIERGDLLVLATDGLRSDVMDHVDAFAAPDLIVARLMARCRTGRDDALALAARYDGGSS